MDGLRATLPPQTLFFNRCGVQKILSTSLAKHRVVGRKTLTLIITHVNISLSVAYYHSLAATFRVKNGHYVPATSRPEVTAQQVITFTRRERRLSLDHVWRSGDLEFAFRTAQHEAVILHQVAVAAGHTSTFADTHRSPSAVKRAAERARNGDKLASDNGDGDNGDSHNSDSDNGDSYFKISLRNANEIEFAYTLNGVPRTTRLATRYKMNTGEWQMVRVDTDGQHIRFSVNLDDFMIDLKEHEHLPLDGHTALTIGGSAGDQEAELGFVGCIRGLAINARPVDLYSQVQT